MFLPQTQPENLADARLPIVDGHGSLCLRQMYDFMLPKQRILTLFPCSCFLYPLALGSWLLSSLKTAYRRRAGKHTPLTDTTKVGKAKLLEFFAKA